MTPDYLLPSKGAFIQALEPLTCSICSGPYDSTHVATQLQCGHIFGNVCLVTWCETRKYNAHTCPVCRRALFNPDGDGNESEYDIEEFTSEFGNDEDEELNTLLNEPIPINTTWGITVNGLCQIVNGYLDEGMAQYQAINNFMPDYVASIIHFSNGGTLDTEPSRESYSAALDMWPRTEVIRATLLGALQTECSALRALRQAMIEFNESLPQAMADEFERRRVNALSLSPPLPDGPAGSPVVEAPRTLPEDRRLRELLDYIHFRLAPLEEWETQRYAIEVAVNGHLNVVAHELSSDQNITWWTVESHLSSGQYDNLISEIICLINGDPNADPHNKADIYFGMRHSYLTIREDMSTVINQLPNLVHEDYVVGRSAVPLIRSRAQAPHIPQEQPHFLVPSPTQARAPLPPQSRAFRRTQPLPSHRHPRRHAPYSTRVPQDQSAGGRERRGRRRGGANQQ